MSITIIVNIDLDIYISVMPQKTVAD